jgi:hypothetical protein
VIRQIERDGRVGAQIAQCRQDATIASGSHHSFSAKVLGNLDGKLARDPGRPKNQDHFARLELGAPAERKPSR